MKIENYVTGHVLFAIILFLTFLHKKNYIKVISPYIHMKLRLDIMFSLVLKEEEWIMSKTTQCQIQPQQRAGTSPIFRPSSLSTI